jgi:hypothetical protein
VRCTHPYSKLCTPLKRAKFTFLGKLKKMGSGISEGNDSTDQQYGIVPLSVPYF